MQGVLFHASGSAVCSWHGMLYHCAVLCCAVLCCAVLCCAVLCCAVLCCAALRCAVLCCAVLCCAVLCCAVLCCAVAGVQQLTGQACCPGCSGSSSLLLQARAATSSSSSSSRGPLQGVSWAQYPGSCHTPGDDTNGATFTQATGCLGTLFAIVAVCDYSCLRL
jgi:hypothetical protein